MCFFMAVGISFNEINDAVGDLFGEEFLKSIGWILALLFIPIFFVSIIPAGQAMIAVVFGKGGIVPLVSVQIEVDRILEELSEK